MRLIGLCKCMKLSQLFVHALNFYSRCYCCLVVFVVVDGPTNRSNLIDSLFLGRSPKIAFCVFFLSRKQHKNRFLCSRLDSKWEFLISFLLKRNVRLLFFCVQQLITFFLCWFLTHSLGGFTLMHTPSFQKFNDFDNFNWVYVIRLHLMHNLHGGGKERRKKQKFRNYEIDSKKKEKKCS